MTEDKDLIIYNLNNELSILQICLSSYSLKILDQLYQHLEDTKEIEALRIEIQELTRKYKACREECSSGYESFDLFGFNKD